jgi:uncharacterized protein YmfQ (DUF2313 family)
VSELYSSSGASQLFVQEERLDVSFAEHCGNVTVLRRRQGARCCTVTGMCLNDPVSFYVLHFSAQSVVIHRVLHTFRI